MPLLRLAFKNILRHKTRTVLALLGIATSVALVFSIISFNKGFEKGLLRELDATGLHFMIVSSGCPHEVASMVLHGSVVPKFIDIEIVEKLKDFEGIELISPVLVTQMPNKQKGRIDLIHGMQMQHISKLKPSWRINGSPPSNDNEVIVGFEIAEFDRLKVGDTIEYPDYQKTFRVSGILEKTGGQDDAYIYMPLKAIQEIINKPEEITAIGVKIARPEKLADISEEISKKVPGIQIVTMGQVLNSLANLAASAKALSLSIAMIAIIVSAVGVMNLILMAVFERTQEIGMMRAVGASKYDIYKIIMNETIIITISGGAVGIVLTIMASGIIENLVRVLLPYVPSGKMLVFEPFLALSCLVFAILIGIFSGAYPAWKASNISPIEAIKG